MSDHVSNGGQLPTAIGGATRLAYAKAKASGIATDPLLAKATLTAAQVEDASSRIEVIDQVNFLNLVATAVSDEFLGFHLGQQVELRSSGLLYYVLASSATMVEALRRAVRYSSIVNEGVVLKCVEQNCLGLSVHYAGVSRHIDRHQIEFLMAIILRICQRLSGLRLTPTAVRFVHHRDKHATDFDAFFGQPEFDAAVDEITFEEKIRQLPVVSADPYLCDLVTGYAEAAIKSRTNISGPFRSSVENAIAPLLPHGEVRAGVIARGLGVSQRTLSRRLANEGLSFTDVLEHLRRDMANRFLAENYLSISQIAWLLGYREASALSHAYRRWTGRSPTDMRPHI